MSVQESVTIRPFRPSDVPGVQHVMLTIYKDDFKYGYKPAWHSDFDTLVETYSMSNSVLFVAEQKDGTIVGTGGARIGGICSHRAPPALKRQFPPFATVNLVRHFVLPHCRRQGIGTRLVRQCVEWVDQKGCFDNIVLNTEFAIDFWKQMGAVEIFDERKVGGWCVFMKLPFTPRPLPPFL